MAKIIIAKGKHPMAAEVMVIDDNRQMCYIRNQDKNVDELGAPKELLAIKEAFTERRECPMFLVKEWYDITEVDEMPEEYAKHMQEMISEADDITLGEADVVHEVGHF